MDAGDPSTGSDASTAPQPRANKYYPRTGKRGAPQAFPRKLFEILSEQPAEIISWNPSGLAFMIHDMPRFVSEVLQKYFAHQKFSSFQRQLNLYGYRRIEPGGDEPAGSYYHPSFRQDGEDLVGEVRRTPQSQAAQWHASQCSGAVCLSMTDCVIRPHAHTSSTHTPHAPTPRPVVAR